MSPMEPSRTMSRRSRPCPTSCTSASCRRISPACSASAMVASCISLLHGTQHVAAGMVFGIADYFHSSPALHHYVALGHALGGVIGALGLDLRADFAHQSPHVGLGKDHHRIHILEGGDDFGALLFRHEGAALALQAAGAG